MSAEHDLQQIEQRLRARAQLCRVVSFQCDFFALPQAAQDALYGIAGELEEIAGLLVQRKQPERPLQHNPEPLQVTNVPMCRRCHHAINRCTCGMLGSDVADDEPAAVSGGTDNSPEAAARIETALRWHAAALVALADLIAGGPAP